MFVAWKNSRIMFFFALVKAEDMVYRRVKYDVTLHCQTKLEEGYSRARVEVIALGQNLIENKVHSLVKAEDTLYCPLPDEDTVYGRAKTSAQFIAKPKSGKKLFLSTIKRTKFLAEPEINAKIIAKPKSRKKMISWSSRPTTDTIYLQTKPWENILSPNRRHEHN